MTKTKPTSTGPAHASSEPFLTDVRALRANARKQIDHGPITAAYSADLDRLLELLNTCLATEIVCVLRYKAHFYGAQGLDSEPAAEQFLQHAAEEQVHADRLAARIDQLGGRPELNPATLVSRAQTQYTTPEALLDMIKEDLVAERIVIQAYSEAIRWLGHNDPRPHGGSSRRSLPKRRSTPMTCSRCCSQLSGERR